jgi:hypothetical protein
MIAQEPDLWGLLVPFFFSIALAINSYLLAKDKGRNVVLWTILGFVPFINACVIWYFVGAANLKLEKKLDALLNKEANL